ncbi:hypothetical protein RUM44_004880 [Polyplax serrata]|uniref:Uncharacterized protein n=1 Tax=Polyplax serrata TaxID=468196 RepID=A0ABR1B411_POLSC
MERKRRPKKVGETLGGTRRTSDKSQTPVEVPEERDMRAIDRPAKPKVSCVVSVGKMLLTLTVREEREQKKKKKKKKVYKQVGELAEMKRKWDEGEKPIEKKN